MKLAKKTLSVFLSLLMIFSTCSVCLTGFSFTAAAATGTVSSVKTAISAAASKINSKSAASNAYNYTGDDGTVMNAAEEVYAYTVSLRGGTGSTSSNNSTRSLLATVASKTGYTSGANYNALMRLINPTGTTVIGYENRSECYKESRHWAGSSHNYPSLPANSITKTVNVKATLDNVLCKYDDVNDIPSTILLDVTYQYGHTYDQTASDGSYNWRKGYLCKAYRWNYLNSVTRTVNSQNTTAASELQAYAAYFTDARLATTAKDLLNKTSTELQANYDEAYAKYTSLTTKYSATVVNHFFDTAAIEAYIGEVEFALQVVLAQPAMQIMLDCMKNGYDANDIDNMTSVYATAKEAYDIIKNYNEEVFNFVIANYPGFDDFSFDAATTFINQLYYDIELYQLRELKKTIDADIASNEAKVADPLNETDITDIELAALKDRLDGYQASWAQYSAEANAAVFTEGKDYIIEFRAAVVEKINTRNADVDYEAFYAYYLPYIFANIADWSKDEIVTRYNEDTAKQTELDASYEKHYGIIGEELVNTVFTITYNDEPTLLTDAVADYISRLLVVADEKNNTQLDAVAEYVGTSTEINFSNFVGLKTSINNINHDLYNIVLDNGLVDSERKAIYDALDELLKKYDEFVASGGFSDFEQTHYHDGNGIFVTRYAGDQRDADGEQLGFVNDVAREGKAENYDVTEAKVNETIVKLDNFLVSEDFCSLVGFEDEEGNPYGNLSEAIEDLIQTNLFTDELVNTLIAAIFPMVCNLVTNLLGDLSSLGIDGVSQSPDPNAAARIDLSVLSNGDFKGQLDLYIDGQYSTKKLVDVFEGLGIYLYPQSFAKKVPAKYAETKSALNAAGLDWNKFADEEGKIVLDFVWGVTDYNSFVNVVGVIFDAILPLLKTLLTGSDYSQKIDNLAYAKAYDMVVKDALDLGFLGKPDISIISAEAYANLQLSIAGETVFKDMWIPVMEALGVTEGGYDLSGLGINGTYSFKSINANSTSAQIADAMFSPLLVIIEQLKYQPLEKVLDILPQIVYTLSFDSIQSMIDGIQIDIAAEIEINDFKSLKIVEIFGWEPDLDWLGNLLKGTLNGLLPSFDIPLALGDMVNLEDMLGFEYTNLNSLIAYVLETLGMTGLELPTINAGEIITCASLNKNAPSAGSAGKRNKLTADRADVFYFLLKYIISAVGDREFLEGIIEFIQLSGLELTVDTDGDGVPDAPAEEPEPVELPDIVYNIINNVNADPMSALAALVELFVPQRYEKEDMDWVVSQYDYASIEGINDASIVYLNYGNDWTKQKADYLVDNVDAIVESVLSMTGSEETSINALIQKAFNGILTNKSITSIISGLSELGTLLGDEFIYELLDRELEVDLTAMYDAFAYLFVTDEDRAKEDFVEPLKPTDAGYENIYAITATQDAEGNITWSYNGTEFADGDAETFVDLLCESIKEFAPLIAAFLKGENIGLFNDAIEFLGYENYADSVGIFFELLGIADVMTQAEYEAYCEANGDIAALNYLVKQLFNWFDGYILDGNTVQKIVELLPNLVYFIESNGLSTVIHNLLMPVLVILDTVRPIIDIDLNAVASLLISDLINYGKIDTNVLLQFISGIYVNDDLDYKWFAVDLGNLTLSNIVPLVDIYFGTDFASSQLINPGLKGLCSGVAEYDSVVDAKAYKTNMDAADAITILLSSVLEAAEYEVADGKTNGDIICEFVDAELVKKGEEAQAAEIYSAVVDLIKGLEISYTVPNWGYMLTADAELTEKVVLPTPSIVYLGYSTDWTDEVADSVYGILDDVLDLVLPAVLEEGETLDTLINGLLEDNVYSDAVLNELVELIVNAISALDGSLRDLIDVAIDTDIAAWFAMCEETVGEDGKPKFVCTKNWGIDAAADADKKTIFIAALKEVLTPAERLLSWLFFGNDIALFTGSEVNADGEYVYNDIITVNGGEGYAYGLVPIFEALGCTMQPASAYATTADAVEGILNALFARVDEITANPVEEVFELLPNLIYFINADGLVSCVNNLLAPVDGLIAKLSPIISEDGSEVSIGGLLEPVIGFNISNMTTETLLNIGVDKGFVFSDEIVDIISTLYVGNLAEFESANGNKAYRLDVTDAEGDVLTIVLSIALDLFKLNKETFAPLMGEDIYDSVVTLIAGAVSEFTYKNPDWAYMYDGENALEQLIANGLPARTEENSMVYLQYTNNWNRETALYLDDILFDLIKGITEDARDDGKDVGILLDDAITNGLYQDDILNSLIEAVVGLMIDYEEIIKGAGALLGAESIADWFDYCTVTTDENGKTVVTCTKDWGVDAATTNEAKREAFVEGFVVALEPAYDLLAWLLFGEDYEFLNGTTSEVLITIKGGKGYAEGLVPLLEALGCTMGADTASGIKAPADFYVNGELDMEQAVRDVFGALAGWLHEICGDMNNGAIDVMLDKLPNVVYFINAGGLKAVVNNLLQPVNFILEALKPMGVNVDFSTLIKQIDITNIDFYEIFDLVEDIVPLYFPDEVQKFVAEFWMGEVVEFTSANGKQAFRMQYTEAECRADMITVLISLVLESAQDPRNEAKLSDWLGEDIYWAILNVLRLEKCKDMEEFAWILTEYANTGEQFSAIDTSTRYAAYNDIWTKDKAQDMADNLGYMSGNLLHLLGVQINGEKTYDLESVLNALISTNLYTQEMADTILNAVKDLLSNLTELEPYGEYIIDILNTAFDVDLTAYDTMTLTVEDGSREDFEAALGQIIAPIVPLLEVILCGENISLFYELDGSETIVLYGSEGYAYGIIPVMEALGCTMPTPAEFKEIVKNDPDAAIRCITTPLLDRVDKIVADPVNGLGEILASSMYFINSNGLETAFTNLVAAVDTVLAGLENVVGAASLEELLDIDLSEFNAEYIVNLVADLLSESTGMDFAPVAANLVAELTFGEVVTYDSANGETYYTMKATGNDEADMLTAVLRMAIDFVTTEDNLAKIKTLLADAITNETAYNSICSILDTLAGYVAEDPGMSTALNFIYTVLDAAGTALENTDDVYHDVNNSWQFILKLLSTSEEPLLRDFAEDLKGTLNKYFDGIFTEEGVAPDGALTFFDKLKAFFEKIAEFFRKLFGME